MRRFLLSLISWIFICTIISLSSLSVERAIAASCTHYASPTGTGDGASAARPFRISNFWKIAKPGYTLCLLHGQYTGVESMITPPNGLRGTASAPITVRAVNDGGPWINGQGVRNPFFLKNNDFFIIEGIDVSDSSGTTMLIDKGANNNIIRRVCAWNGRTVWLVTNAQKNLLEDVCAFGSGNKMFSNPGGGYLDLTIRRAWAVWERGTMVGPKLVFESTYASRGTTYENNIGTWKESGSGATDQRYSIFGTAGLSQSNQCAEAKLLGSIAYIRSPDIVGGALGIGFFGSRSVDCVLVKDLIVNIEGHPTLRPIHAQKFDGIYKTETTALNAPFRQRVFRDVTQIGGGTSSISTDTVNGWGQINHVVVDSVSAANSAGANPLQLTSGNGARICKRYTNGVLSNQPLWPWPMDSRINAALSRAGKDASDYFRGTAHTVTSEIETQFGQIPSGCRSTSSYGITIPTPPTNLLLKP